jgi:hypothetical protein
MTQSLRIMGAHCCVLDHYHIMVSGPLKPAAFDPAAELHLRAVEVSGEMSEGPGGKGGEGGTCPGAGSGHTGAGHAQDLVTPGRAHPHRNPSPPWCSYLSASSIYIYIYIHTQKYVCLSTGCWRSFQVVGVDARMTARGFVTAYCAV